MMDEELPATAGDVARDYPEVWQAYETLGEACANAGPIDTRERRLIKLALAIGAQSEGAVHSHCRRAIQEGISREELEHVAMMTIATLGFPAAAAALSWIRDVTWSG